ncbi:tail sheath stabilizer [Pseudomonas phage PspYZU05]|uniref:Tail sheath stabilizer and completion protein n=1 Tax=Pseudomonas phage PspYZU05 TaxID=1983556 RepID=A0A2U7N539_9CAUD|nr:tail sheath stabilizer [Pseudomonas phage PspYZU05]ASD52076.1 tail sheath stabilizer and completion protein [Pseudomonas phage PspYZU05]
MGDLFSRVQVKKERSDGVRLIKVPITYASKEHFMMKLNKLNSINSTENVAKVETILPRMYLNLVDMMYNPTYKTNILNRTANKGSGVGTISQYNPTPIKMIFEMGIFTRNQDDMFQIIEQIIPYFQPHFNTTITELYPNDITFDRDIRIVLQSILIDEQLEGENTSRRTLQWTLNFEVNGWLYPPVADVKGEIRSIYLNFDGSAVDVTDSYSDVEKVNTHVVPIDVPEEDWDGSYVQEYK